MIVVRAADRFETVQPGIRTWHCFSAGQHYDPSNVAFGPVVGVDEHVLEPGAGFSEHAHRGVEILSFVADGALRHGGDVDVVITAGETYRQDASLPIKHDESNAGDKPLRFIQSTVLAGAGAALAVHRGTFRVDAEWSHVFVVSGSWRIGHVTLSNGDSVRADSLLQVHGDGVVLVLS